MDKAKPFQLKKNLNIGSPDAETDEMLHDVFVNTHIIEQIEDTANQKSILIGRTGSGKSAIIKYLKNGTVNFSEISPEAMSLKFLSNSTILRHFNQINVNLNLFYKILWKHVFIVELLKLFFKDEKFNIQSNHFFRNIIDNIKNKTVKRNPNRDRAIKYLENWTDDFWKETEYRIKSLEEKIKKDFLLELGVKIDVIGSKLSKGESVEQSYLIEAKSKAESIIQKSQSSDLIEIQNIMRDELFVDHQKKFYIIIDDLDKEWVEDQYRYQLISAMIDVIKEFRQFKGVKIVIALRENLTDMVITGCKNKGGQRDKLKPLFAYLEWETEELKTFLDYRLKKISNNQLDVTKAFHRIRRDNKTGFDYVIERTYYRPRDIITYINLSIEESNNKTSFTRDILYKVEKKYSLYRFQALEDEWYENYGNFKDFTKFLIGIPNGFKLRTVNENSFEDLFFNEETDENISGILQQGIIDWRNDKIKFNNFIKTVIFVFYRIGILGVKKGPTYPVAYYYTQEVPINENDITNNCRFYIHPALYSYFKVNVKQQMPEDEL